MTTSSSCTVVPPAELVALERAALAAVVAARGAGDWDAGTRRSALALIEKVAGALALVRSTVITAEREAGTWSLRGDRDLAGFVGRETRGGRGAGIAAVGQAATLAAMPVLADALVDGPVTVKHVEQVARATSGSPALATELATSEGQGRVVELAGRLDGSEFGKALARLSASLDPALRQRSHDEQRAGRFLNLSHTPSGTLLKGRLDTVAGHELAKALDALSPRPAVDDDRSREQRAADALASMARRVLSDRRTTPDATAPVQALLVLTEPTWTALRATGNGARRATVEGSATQVMDALRDVAPVVDETGQAWPASEIARALCDCALTRAVVAGKDAPLNLGRGERLFGRQHWLALYAAGQRTCAMPGCTMPLAYCELHHVRWWLRHHGRTDLTNCAPYCGYHHHEIHRRDLTVTRRPDGSLDHRYPDGRPYGTPSASAPPAGALSPAAGPSDDCTVPSAPSAQVVVAGSSAAPDAGGPPSIERRPSIGGPPSIERWPSIGGPPEHEGSGQVGRSSKCEEPQVPDGASGRGVPREIARPPVAESPSPVRSGRYRCPRTREPENVPGVDPLGSRQGALFVA